MPKPAADLYGRNWTVTPRGVDNVEQWGPAHAQVVLLQEIRDLLLFAYGIPGGPWQPPVRRGTAAAPEVDPIHDWARRAVAAGRAIRAKKRKGAK